jgi:iron(III) transport system ATP-binding protein
MQQPSLSVTGLRKVYASGSGIEHASFTLPPGNFFTLLGPSGCGKTTTLRCIAGLEEPDQGTIQVGRDMFFDAAAGISVPLNRREIGMVFQSYAIWPHMSVFENVAFPLRVAKDRSYDRAEMQRLVGDALAVVDLDGFGARSATQLSGGQQQRVALARAIVRQPKLLLLDEPLSNLDAALREGMRNELRRLQRQLGVTTIYVTHDQAEALEMSDTIAVLNRGRIVQMGPPREIYFHPRDAFVAGFVGTTNLLPGVVQATSGGVVRLAGGETMRCVLPEGAQDGQAVSVSVRPETIILLDRGMACAVDANRMTGTVEQASFIGDRMRYGVRVGDRLMLVYAPPAASLAVGDTAMLAFPPEAAVAVPA